MERHSAVFLEELGHISIKVGLRLKPDARQVDPRAPPEPMDADAVTEPAGAGVAGTLVSTGMLAGARRLAGTVGVSTPAVAVGAEMSLGVGRDPGGSSGHREAAGCRYASGGSGRRGTGGTGVRAGELWIGARAGDLGGARGTGNLGGSDSGAGSCRSFATEAVHYGWKRHYGWPRVSAKNCFVHNLLMHRPTAMKLCIGIPVSFMHNTVTQKQQDPVTSCMYDVIIASML